eukprot:436597-Prorocentrum_minimum.AAC.1
MRTWHTSSGGGRADARGPPPPWHLVTIGAPWQRSGHPGNGRGVESMATSIAVSIYPKCVWRCALDE